MSSYLIKGGYLIDPANKISQPMDLRIEDGLVQEVKEEIKPKKTDEVIDAIGKVIAPGFIDLHCHLREPGQEAKEDMISGSNSAAAGGFTTILTMANTRPIIDKAIILEGMKFKAQKDSLVHIELVGAVTKELQGKELAELGDMALTGAAAFSDDGGFVSDSRLMRAALEYSAAYGLPVISHAEDESLVHDGVMHEGDVSARLGMRGRPAVAEDIAVSREIMLAEFTDGRVHIAHVSSKGAVELIRRAKAKGIAVTGEVTPHHLCLTDEDLSTFDSAFKVNPPLRDQSHVDALLEGLKDGTLDAITTDHAPHAFEEKDCEFPCAPSGFSGFETAFGAMNTYYVKTGKISLELLIEKLTSGPAQAFSWTEKGSLGKGKPADLVLIDPDQKWTVDSEEFYTRGKVCPFQDHEFVGKVTSTMVDGKWVYLDGKVQRER